MRERSDEIDEEEDHIKRRFTSNINDADFDEAFYGRRLTASHTRGSMMFS